MSGPIDVTGMTADEAAARLAKIRVAVTDWEQVVSSKRLREDADAPRAAEWRLVYPEVDPEAQEVFDALQAGREAASHNGSKALEATTTTVRRTVPMAEQLARAIEPVDWTGLWNEGETNEEWLAEPLIPRGRQVAVYSPAKLGKSLLALDMAAAMAAGRPVLGFPAGTPVTVLYLDLEMTRGDLRERLDDLGYGPGENLSRLVYFQLPSLPSLDTDRGGQVLDALVAKYRPELVIIDTLGRVVDASEDRSDTYLKFYRCSGRRLKEQGVSLLRLDHAGKDIARGQRGSSAKVDDVDVVFRLAMVENKVVLTRTHSRVSWVPQTIALVRETEPNLRHVLAEGAWPESRAEVARILDELAVPIDASVSMATRALKLAGKGRRKVVVMAALKWRRVRP